MPGDPYCKIIYESLYECNGVLAVGGASILGRAPHGLLSRRRFSARTLAASVVHAVWLAVPPHAKLGHRCLERV